MEMKSFCLQTFIFVFHCHVKVNFYYAKAISISSIHQSTCEWVDFWQFKDCSFEFVCLVNCFVRLGHFFFWLVRRTARLNNLKVKKFLSDQFEQRKMFVSLVELKKKRKENSSKSIQIDTFMLRVKLGLNQQSFPLITLIANQSQKIAS